MIRFLLTGIAVVCAFTSFAQQKTGEVPDSIKAMVDRGDAQFAMIEKSAEYPGGMGMFYKYLKEKMKVPKKARQAGVRGRVYVEFVINKDGSIDPATVRCPGTAELNQYPQLPADDLVVDEDCRAEVMRLIKKSPAWIPASHKGKPVMQKMMVPVFFR